MSGSEERLELADRLRGQLTELASVGADPDGGVSRLAYSDAERAAHRLVAGWAAADEARVEVDAAGNSLYVYAEGEPYMLLGSHLDTVPHGGDYDGTSGVVTAMAAARRCRDLGRGVRVVAFAGEEGARFGRPNLGSALAAGLLTTEETRRLRDAEGVTLDAAAHAVGLDLATVEPWLDRRASLFLEVHIEQGTILETTGTSIGLVDAIAGAVRLRVEFAGFAAHSGATPMQLRQDALVAAAEAVLAVEAAARIGRQTVATVGRLNVSPNSVTTVPGLVELWVDIRDTDPETQRRAARKLIADLEEIATRRGVRVSFDVVAAQPPVMLAAWLRTALRDACTELDVRYRVLPSGAGHDAAIVARRTDAAMLFVPCRGGVSHSPLEHADEQDLALASDVLVGALRHVAALPAA